MNSEPCPTCKGRCCRDYYLYRVVHMGAEHYQHDCEACDDGTKYVPPVRPPDVRKGIVKWMRDVADIYAAREDLIGDGYARNWRIIADMIEQEEDTKPIKVVA